jgi:hypothetical protein
MCSISNRLRKHLVYPQRDPSSLGYYKVVAVEDIKLVDPVAIGDQVKLTDAGQGTGVISEILPRTTKLTRRWQEAARTGHRRQCRSSGHRDVGRAACPTVAAP